MILFSVPLDTSRQSPGLASLPPKALRQLRPQRCRRRRLPRAGTNQIRLRKGLHITALLYFM